MSWLPEAHSEMNDLIPLDSTSFYKMGTGWNKLLGSMAPTAIPSFFFFHELSLK